MQEGNCGVEMRVKKDCRGKRIVTGLFGGRSLDDTVERNTLWCKAGDVLEDDGNDDEGNKYTLNKQIQKTVYLLYISAQISISIRQTGMTYT